MKTIKKMMVIFMTVTMTIAAVNIADYTNVHAKSIVRSVKVKGVKKKFTMNVGDKKTFTVKVKAQKKKTAFRVKSSDKKIVKITKKGKKITITALKKGKVKVTVQSKYNKKKKYVMTITVNEKDIQEENIPLSMTGEVLNSEIFALNFSKKVDLKLDNIVVERKENEDGEYITAKIDGIATEDKRIYSIVVDSASATGDYVKITVLGLDKLFVTELKVIDKKATRTIDFKKSIKAGESLNKEYNLNYGDKNYKLKSIINIPKGLTYEFNESGSITFMGAISKVGIYTAVAKVEDTKGVINTFNFTFVVGDKENIFAFCTSDEVYAYNNAGHVYEWKGTLDPTISGGSGKYHCEIAEDRAKIFSMNNGRLDYAVSKPGMYKAKIKVIDANDENLFTIMEFKMVVQPYIRITGKVTNSDGSPIENAYVIPKPLKKEAWFVYTLTDREGKYTAYVQSGRYNMYSFFNESKSIVPNRIITKDATINFVYNDLYTVKLNTKYEPKHLEIYGEWYNNDDYEPIGYGKTLFLKEGSYQLESEGYMVMDNRFYEYEATLNLSVSGNMDAKIMFLTLKEKRPKYYIPAEINATSRPLEDGVIYRFTAPDTAKYKFTGDYEGDRVEAMLLDKDYNIIKRGDAKNDLDFYMEYDLTADEVYYLVVLPYGYYETYGKINISEVNGLK